MGADSLSGVDIKEGGGMSGGFAEDELRALLRAGGKVLEDGTITLPDGTWGCLYCSGAGYEDYPSRNRPCRIAGHAEKSDVESGWLFKASSGSSI